MSKSRTNTNFPSWRCVLRRPLRVLSDKDVVPDSIAIASPNVTASGWKDFYVGIVKGLKPGLTELIVHLAHDDAEFQAISVDHPDYGAAWRQRDYDVITSADFKKSLEENHVILIQWRDLKKLLQ